MCAMGSRPTKGRASCFAAKRHVVMFLATTTTAGHVAASAALGSVAAMEGALSFCQMLIIVARAVESARRGLSVRMDIVVMHKMGSLQEMPLNFNTSGILVPELKSITN